MLRNFYLFVVLFISSSCFGQKDTIKTIAYTGIPIVSSSSDRITPAEIKSWVFDDTSVKSSCIYQSPKRKTQKKLLELYHKYDVISINSNEDWTHQEYKRVLIFYTELDYYYLGFIGGEEKYMFVNGVKVNLIKSDLKLLNKGLSCKCRKQLGYPKEFFN